MAKLYKRRDGSRPKVLPLLVRGEIDSHHRALDKRRSSMHVYTSPTICELLSQKLYGMRRSGGGVSQGCTARRPTARRAAAEARPAVDDPNQPATLRELSSRGMYIEGLVKTFD